MSTLVVRHCRSSSGRQPPCRRKTDVLCQRRWVRTSGPGFDPSKCRLNSRAFAVLCARRRFLSSRTTHASGVVMRDTHAAVCTRPQSQRPQQLHWMGRIAGHGGRTAQTASRSVWLHDNRRQTTDQIHGDDYVGCKCLHDENISSGSLLLSRRILCPSLGPVCAHKSR